jgi:hypothetical protein
MPQNLIKVPIGNIVKIELIIRMSYYEEQTIAGNLVISGNEECVKLIETLNSLESLNHYDEKIPKRIVDEIVGMINETEKEFDDKMSEIRRFIEDWKKEGGQQ